MNARFFFSLFAASAGLATAATSEPIIAGEAMTVFGRSGDPTPATVSRVELTNPAYAWSGLEKLGDETANFAVATSGVSSFNSVFALRGLTNTPIFGDPAVTFYLDDVPLAGAFTLPDQLTGFASVEVLRGPGAGLTLGRTGSAGAVRLSSATPTADGGELRGSLGDYGLRSVSASVTERMSAAADGTFAFGATRQNGFLYNTTTGERIDRRDTLTGLARFHFRPTHHLELRLLAHAWRNHDGEQPMVPLGGPWFTVARAHTGQTQVEAANVGLTAAYRADWGQLRSTTSLNYWRIGPYLSVLNFGPVELLNDVHLRLRQINEELQAEGDLGASVHWTAGGCFSEGNTRGAFSRVLAPMGMDVEGSTYEIAAQQSAAFAQATVTLAPGLRLEAGLRGEAVDKQLKRQEVFPTTARFQRNSDSTALLPKLALIQDLSRTLQWYANLGAGYKPGGFSAFTGNAALAAFGPERTKAMESGLTHHTLDQKWQGTVRTFWYEITGYQIERSFATGAATDDYLVVNAPKARSLGAEVELQWRPVTGLDLGAHLGLTQVTLRDFRDPYTGITYNGKRAPFVPALDAGARLAYRHASGLFIGADASLTGRVYYTEGEAQAFAQRAYTLVNARVGYAHGDWSVQFVVENLTDRCYYRSITAGTGHASPGAPRTYAVETTWRF